MPSFSSFLIIAGFAVIAHAAFSGIHYKSWYESLGEEVAAGFVPIDVKIEVAVGFFLSLVGTLFNVRPFEEIDAKTSMISRKFDQFVDTPNFRVFNHRAAGLERRQLRNSKK